MTTSPSIKYWQVLIPALILVALSASNLNYQLPSIYDQLAESYQPLKTLKFFHARGATVHKWGPTQNFVQAPVYGAMMAWWYFNDEIDQPSSDYPYGLKRPLQQLSAMVFAGRAMVLAVSIFALTFFTWHILKIIGANAGLAVLILFTVSCPGFAYASAATKPDGLMMAFLACAIGLYLTIVFNGLTVRGGVWLSIFAVLSLSCKELSAPLFIPTYLAIAARGWFQTRPQSVERKTFLRAFAWMFGAGVIAYLLINVIYAPGAWIERLSIVFGDLKSPDIWASPDWTLASYLHWAFIAVISNLGIGGSIMALATCVATLIWRPRHAIMLWVPFITHVLVVILTAGYIPERFMLPLAILITLPAVGVLHEASRRGFWRRLATPLRHGLITIIIALIAIDLLGSIGFAVAMRMTRIDSMAAQYLQDFPVADDEVVYPFTMHPRHPGVSHLSSLGHNVSDAAFHEIILGEAPKPDWVFVDSVFLDWLKDFKRMSARDAHFAKGSGYNYSQFEGFEALGYELTREYAPRFPPYAFPSLVAMRHPLNNNRLLVLHLKKNDD